MGVSVMVEVVADVTRPAYMDLTMRGVSFILLLHLFRQNKVLSALLGTGMLGNVFAGLAFIPIWYYNGQRGFIRGRWLKYCFYAFYPLHLLVLWRVKVQMFGRG